MQQLLHKIIILTCTSSFEGQNILLLKNHKHVSLNLMTNLNNIHKKKFEVDELVLSATNKNRVFTFLRFIFITVIVVRLDSLLAFKKQS